MLAGPETDVLALQAMRDALTEGRECRTVIKNYRKDGSTFWNELSLAPVRDSDGRLTHFVGIQTDASLRVRVGELALAQQELEELVAQRTRELAEALGGLERRRRFTDTVLNALAAGVVTTDRAGRVSFVNRAAQELLRLSLADCLGKPVLEVLGADPVLQAALQKTGAREARGVECQVGASGGARFVAGLTIVHASGEAGDELGHILLFRELLGGRPYGGRATGATGAESEVRTGAAPGPEPAIVTAADADAESQALPTPPARPRAVAPLTLLQEALAQLAGAGEVRHPVIENPFQATPQVWVDPGTATEALRLLLETGHTLVAPPGRVRVRVRYEARAGLATHDLRLELAPDGAAAEQAPRSPWPHTVDLNLDRAQQLLMSQAGRLEVARDEDGRWVLSAFLPREPPVPHTT
jgi:PAS domain-containing protein